MPEQLPQVAVLRVRHPDAGESLFQHEPQQQLCILPIRLLLAHSLGADLGRVSDPQLQRQIAQQPLTPARVSAGLHAHTRFNALLPELAVELLGFLPMRQAALTEFATLGIYKRDLLKARMIVTALYLASHSLIASLHATGMGQIGFRREADRSLRRCRFAA